MKKRKVHQGGCYPCFGTDRFLFKEKLLVEIGQIAKRLPIAIVFPDIKERLFGNFSGLSKRRQLIHVVRTAALVIFIVPDEIYFAH